LGTLGFRIVLLDTPSMIELALLLLLVEKK
jgi:hypothetical protein